MFLMLTWNRVFLRWTGVSTCLGAGAGGAIRPSSVPAGLLRQHFDTFRGMISGNNSPSFSDRQCIHCLSKTGYLDIDSRQAIRQPRIEDDLPASSLFKLQRSKTKHGNYSNKQVHLSEILRWYGGSSRDQIFCQCLVV
jgi:hypothetical protein